MCDLAGRHLFPHRAHPLLRALWALLFRFCIYRQIGTLHLADPQSDPLRSCRRCPHVRPPARRAPRSRAGTRARTFGGSAGLVRALLPSSLAAPSQGQRERQQRKEEAARQFARRALWISWTWCSGVDRASTWGLGAEALPPRGSGGRVYIVYNVPCTTAVQYMVLLATRTQGDQQDSCLDQHTRHPFFLVIVRGPRARADKGGPCVPGRASLRAAQRACARPTCAPPPLPRAGFDACMRTGRQHSSQPTRHVRDFAA